LTIIIAVINRSAMKKIRQMKGLKW
jgi:hypothetical protein